MFLALVLGMLMILSGCTDLSGFKTRSATNQYIDGDYQAAFEEFGEVLAQGVDKPWLHYNMGNAAYMNGDFEQAQTSYSRALESASETEAGANVEYNMGNSFYRIAEQLEPSDLQGALELYNSALLQYRITMEQDANDLDAKFNYELTQRKIKELTDKLENQENSSDETGENQKEESSKEEDSNDSKQSETDDESSEQQGTSEQEEQNAQDGDMSSNAEQEGPQTCEETDASSQEHEEQGMTMEEALMLLESMEDEEAERMNMYVPGNLPEVEKDW